MQIEFKKNVTNTPLECINPPKRVTHVAACELSVKLVGAIVPMNAKDMP